ncbi:MAG TPA: dTMP kinase [Phycisphaerales bacterium]|nr:dTMP kinase [Phycisphaerales bacterium]HIB49704.1 dTMP kinase [Phycisphaerales bacterium]HIN84579.1 dTMP kinase [Phycisphaerales bacterium]HIO20699.1 dTMP kinase [Phycisphaerales bacterium]HIO52730.1 dTMP kinase [Phycisphaerales bacterium]
MNEIASALAGKFIVFDGPDGSGKSTQMRRFMHWCREGGVVVKEVREPGGTSIGEQIRQVLLDTDNECMTIQCEMLLYMASRAQLVEQEIVPSLKRGELVVADRFVSATLAYQGAAGGLPKEWIQQVAEVAVSGNWPDLTLILDVDDVTAAGRLNPLLDRMELKGKNFHFKVREGFLDQVRAMPERYCVIDSTQREDTVELAVQNAIRERFC